MPSTLTSKSVPAAGVANGGMATNARSSASGQSDIQRLRVQHAAGARFASDRIPADVEWLQPFRTTLEKLELRAYWMRANAGQPSSQIHELPGRVHEVLCSFLRGIASSEYTCGRVEALLGLNLPATFRRRFDGWGRRWRQFLVAQGHLRRVGRSPATDALAAWLRSSRPLRAASPQERQRLVQLLRRVMHDHTRNPAAQGNQRPGARSTNAAALAAMHGISSGASSPASSFASSSASSPASSFTASNASSREPSPPNSPVIAPRPDGALQR